MSAALAGVGFVQAVLYLLFVRAIDLYEREPFRYVIPIFVWGFTVAALVSLAFNTLTAVAISAVASAPVVDFLTAVFVAPVVEESAKGFALLVAFAISFLMAKRRGFIEFAGVMDGIVYGSAVGFGFAIVEDLLYYAQFGPETFVMRRIFGGFAHAAFSSLTGIGLGLIPWVRFPFLKLLLPLVGLAAAMFLHSAFNLTATLLGPVAYLALVAVLFVYVALILVWLAVERRVIRGELRDEVGTLISETDYRLIPAYFRRLAYYLGLIQSGRLQSWRRARKTHSAAVELAFTKRLARTSYAPPQGARLGYLRRRVAELEGGTSAGN